eukprot:s689_g52.t1
MIKFPKISISAINGTTIGGGVNLGLLWQDLVAWRCLVGPEGKEDDVTFRYPFGELGLVPELGSSVLLPRVVGLTRAKQLMQYGSEFTAQQALQWGLCTEVVPSKEVLPKAVEAAKKMAKMPQFALRESKRLLQKESTDLVAAIDSITQEELETLRKCIASPETQKAMMALMMKTSKNSSKCPGIPPLFEARAPYMTGQCWKQCKTVLSRFGKAEMERRKWQEKWQAQCAELEELKKEAKESLNIKDVSQAQVAALRERTSRLGIMLGGEGPVAIAFAWFRVAAFWAPLRRKHLANLEKFAAKSSLDRLRRRMKAATGGLHEDIQ